MMMSEEIPLNPPLENGEEKTWTLNGRQYYCPLFLLPQYQKILGLLAKIKLGELIKAWLAISRAYSGELQSGGPTPPIPQKSGTPPSRGESNMDNLNIDIESSLMAIDDEKLLQKFMALILVPVGGEFDETQMAEVEQDVRKMDIEQLGEVIGFFFKRNGGSILNAFGFSAAAAGAAPPEPAAAKSARKTSSSSRSQTNGSATKSRRATSTGA